METILVTDAPQSWSFLKPYTHVVDATSYLTDQVQYPKSTRVINVSCSYRYQSIGYYISLLAEARLHEVMPKACQIQDTLNKDLSQYLSNDIELYLQEYLKEVTDKTYSMHIYFGQSPTDLQQNFAELLNDLFPIPLICIEFIKKKKWTLKKLTPLSIDTIPADHLLFFQESARIYFGKKQKRSLKKFAYDLAILIEPKEETAPSNPKAIKHFIKTGKQFGINVELLTENESKSLLAYDALFIRTTTSVNHYTYQFARRATKDNLIVIDDPTSIIKCTNKVFLAELFNQNNIPTPTTQLLTKQQTNLPPIEFPCVLKKPDSSCSLGVIKVDDINALKSATQQFFKTSDMLLVQPFIYTDFDWRIGIIDNQPLYACRYYMAKDHWQIVDWSSKEDIFIHDSIPIEEVPSAVMSLALQCAALIGDGLYGIDIKSVGDTHYVIEINDNPSINFGIEDAYIKSNLYEKIMDVFLQRMINNNMSVSLD